MLDKVIEMKGEPMAKLNNSYDFGEEAHNKILLIRP